MTAIGIGMVFLAMFAIDNRDYLDTMNEQIKDGYVWKQIECRAPNESLPHIAIEAPNGKKFVCNKLK
tara:strand:- start:39 stop:239 length:201 start_codon:yes stop_codon:yes gene_type:complete